MNIKIKEAISWGKFYGIFGIVTSALSIMSCFGAPIGVLMLIGFMKLNNATDELKRISLKETDPTSQEYEEVISLYGKYLKMLGIAGIVTIVFSVLAVILYIVFIIAMLSIGFGQFTTY